MLRDATKHVLVVDKNVALADTLAMILVHQGYRVSTAHTGKAAVLCAVDESPDLLITVLEMPGMDGLELARIFREHFSECRVIVHTGAERTYLSVSATAEGFDLLDKPMSVEDLVGHVNAAWMDARTMPQL
jgi:DNA-binding response OmpR family regulator